MPETMMKAIQWQKAKGELRACVVATLCSRADNAATEESNNKRWSKFDGLVENFINSVEDDGLVD